MDNHESCELRESTQQIANRITLTGQRHVLTATLRFRLSGPSDLRVVRSGDRLQHTDQPPLLCTSLRCARLSTPPNWWVLNDAAADDTLAGGQGADWFFKAIDDRITDLFNNFAGELTDVL